jgi:hypothetical protein
MNRVCLKCKCIKNNEEYSKSVSRPTGSSYCKKCAALLAKGYYIKNRAKYLERQKNQSVEQIMFKNAKRSAKSSLEFTISIEDIKVPEYCPISIGEL